jgi:hypothetical protein
MKTSMGAIVCAFFYQYSIISGQGRAAIRLFRLPAAGWYCRKSFFMQKY